MIQSWFTRPFNDTFLTFRRSNWEIFFMDIFIDAFPSIHIRWTVVLWGIYYISQCTTTIKRTVITNAPSNANLWYILFRKNVAYIQPHKGPWQNFPYFIAVPDVSTRFVTKFQPTRRHVQNFVWLRRGQTLSGKFFGEVSKFLTPSLRAEPDKLARYSPKCPIYDFFRKVRILQPYGRKNFLLRVDNLASRVQLITELKTDGWFWRLRIYYPLYQDIISSLEIKFTTHLHLLFHLSAVFVLHRLWVFIFSVFSVDFFISV